MTAGRPAGAEGWSYEEVLPYFRKAESNRRFANRYHGTDGPLAVSDPISPLPISAAFIRAAQQAGLPYNPDFNGAEQDGVGYHQTTTRDGRRGSAAVSYLRPAREPAQPDRDHPRPGEPHPGRERPRHRRRISPP